MGGKDIGLNLGIMRDVGWGFYQEIISRMDPEVLGYRCFSHAPRYVIWERVKGRKLFFSIRTKKTISCPVSPICVDLAPATPVSRSTYPACRPSELVVSTLILKRVDGEELLCQGGNSQCWRERHRLRKPYVFVEGGLRF